MNVFSTSYNLYNFIISLFIFSNINLCYYQVVRIHVWFNF